MAYDPENNPYIPGDPASYDLSWVVERLNKHKFAEESAAEAKASAEAAEASAQEASGYADDAEGYKNAASGYADDAEGYRDEAKDYADNIADPVSGLVTTWLANNITQPTTPVIDASLSVWGAAADAMVTGNAVKPFVNASPNLFDNVIDENGYINPSTGQNASASGYKRSSKYYPIFDHSASTLYIHLDPATATFVILFYANDFSYLSYNSANNQAQATITIPPNSYYFRIYVRDDYASDAYVGTENIIGIPAYGYNLNENMIAAANLKNELVNRDNLIRKIRDNTYLNKSTGSTATNTSYRTSERIEIDPNTEYLLGIYNDSNAPSHEYHAITVCFYTSLGAFINNSVYSSDWTKDNCDWQNGLVKFITPATAASLEIGLNDMAKPYKWQLVKSNDVQPFSDYNSINEKAIAKNDKLQGKVIACFGDSIIGDTRDDTCVSSIISKITGAVAYNFGFGGCRMSVHTGNWNECSMYSLADDIYNNDFTTLQTDINNGWSGMPGYFRDRAAWLVNCDFSDVDVIVISYGTNDYREPTSVLDNPNNLYDTSTVCGALRYSIKQILSAYPNIQIIVTCPIFRTFFMPDGVTPDEYSDTKNWGSGTLLDYCNAYRKACEDMNVPFLDLYHTTSFNPYTRLNFYPATDGTHPNAAGRERMGTLIGKMICNLIA